MFESYNYHVKWYRPVLGNKGMKSDTECIGSVYFPNLIAIRSTVFSSINRGRWPDNLPNYWKANLFTRGQLYKFTFKKFLITLYNFIDIKTCKPAIHAWHS